MFDFGFVIPLPAEARPLIAMLRNKKVIQAVSRRIYTGTFRNKKISIIISGCGKIKSASATQYLIDNYPAKANFNYGTAGAISDKLAIGNIIIANYVIEHDVREIFPKKVRPPRHRIFVKDIKGLLKNYHGVPLVWGTILSGDEDIVTTKRKIELHQTYRGLSVDWESAGFTLTCNLNNVRGYTLRGISDYAYEHTTNEYKKNQSMVMNNIIKLLIYLADAM